MKEYTVVDLFCGAGGLSKGFMDAGYNVVFGVDFDDASLKTFSNNHGDAEALKLDLFNLENVNVLKEKLKEKDIEQLDVLIGGPPCQGFSLAGNRVESDKRNTLYTAMVKTAELIRPKVILLENVPGMLTLYNGKVKDRIFEDFENLGYTMSVKVLYAPDYGIPQIRKRAIFIGLLNSNSPFEYPEPILNSEEYISCEDAIGDLPSLEGDMNYKPDSVREYSGPAMTAYQKKMRKNSSLLYNHVPTKHEQKTIDNISLVPDGGKYTDLPGDMSNNFKYHESLHRYNSKKPSLTIDTGHRTHFHYKYNRIPTVRESARLQSFPDDFIFFGNKQEQYKQVGNAVPPLLGYAVANKIKNYLNTKKSKIKFMDLFAGCGGLLDGFMQSGLFVPVASVEWEKAPVNTLRKRLKKKWGIENADEEVIRFDIQREEELFNGFDDPEYGKSVGLDKIVDDAGGIDVIIGGPPCQAYSVAGRNANRMVGDYRNYLFEHYISIVDRYQPKLFVFENVPGMLSAVPDGTLITDLIRRDLDRIGFDIVNDISKNALIDMSDFGIPQNRKRVILIGLNRRYYNNTQDILNTFYNEYLSDYLVNKRKTIYDAIGDLPRWFPLDKTEKIDGKNVSYYQEELIPVNWHVPRYQSQRDINVFRILTNDIVSGNNQYSSTDSLIKLYKDITGKDTAVHKYHVLRKDEPSTTILAHLYKDGFRFIHYDPDQCRTITVREAARIQTFDDDFDFVGSMTDAYKMIGNAVPPMMARIIACTVSRLLDEN